MKKRKKKKRLEKHIKAGAINVANMSLSLLTGNVIKIKKDVCFPFGKK